MTSRQRDRAIKRLALCCVVFAVALAPIATTMQMAEQIDFFVAAAPDEAVMPCHRMADVQEGGTAAGEQSKMTACTCTPWCHAAVSSAVEFAILDVGIRHPIPVARIPASKTANVAPLFKPPIV